MINIFDEFTQLKQVILGDVNLDLVKHLPTEDKNFVQDMLQQTKDDLNAISKIYQAHGIDVKRPEIKTNYSNIIKTPNGESLGIRNPLSPRDTFIVLGNTIIENASWKIESLFEYLYYKNIFLNEFMYEKNCKWIKMPTPNYDHLTFLNDEITNNEPIMDGAQIMRCGDRCFVSVTGAGNELGYEWLRRQFPDFNFIKMPTLIKGHIDAQIKIFKPGLIMSPYTKEQLPSCFASWTHIQSSREHIPISNLQIGKMFRDDDYENTFPTCSIISLNEKVVFIYEHFKDTHPYFIKQLEKNNIDIIWVPFANQHWFNQGITCITLEMSRQGTKEDYFQ